jgi:PhnB protein
MAKSNSPVPPNHHTLTPYIAIRNAADAIEFYKRAFGAEELGRMPSPDGKIMHAEIKIGDSIVMLSDEFPQMSGISSPQTLGGTTCSLMFYTPDVDALYSRAVEAGAAPKMKPEDMFWGDRYGKVADPFGHEWGLATHVEDLTEAEIQERARKFFAKSAA